MQFYIYQFIQHHWPAGCFCLKIVYVHDCFWRLFECFICDHLVLKTSYARAWLDIGLPTFGKMEEKCFCSNQQLLVVCMFVWFCVVLVCGAPLEENRWYLLQALSLFYRSDVSRQKHNAAFPNRYLTTDEGTSAENSFSEIFSLKIYGFFTKKNQQNW